MKKIAIFTEGQSELIFVRELLKKIINLNQLSFDCLKLHSHKLQEVRYKYHPPHASVNFFIINSQGDESVLSAIKSREKKLFKEGYEKIIGLRDMYCEYYDKKSQGKINNAVSQNIINIANQVIQKMSMPDKIIICFSVMELEAWFLSMYSIFPKINISLTTDFIEQQLDFNLQNNDPETNYYRPSTILNHIFQLCGIKYDKSEDDIEMIMAKTDETDFKIAIENGRCRSLCDFYNRIKIYEENI